MVKLDLTLAEKKFLICELAERIKDLAFISAEERVEQALNALLEKVKDKELDLNQPIEITFHYQFLLNDLLQVLARFKRFKEGMQLAKEREN
jgi:hypothetical protein